MVWLNALLAFSLAMVVFCTIVSAMTETMQRLFHMRPKGLRRMIEQLFDEYIWPQLGDALAPKPGHGAPTARASAGDEAKIAARKAFVDLVTRNPAVEPSGPMKILGRWLAPRQLDGLTVMQFIERTAETDVGKAIRNRGAIATTKIADELARRSSRLGEGASLYFAQRAKMISILLALALAFAVNIDAIRLLSAFMTDQQLAQQIIAKADAIKTAYESQELATREASNRESTEEEVQASLTRLRQQVQALEQSADQTSAFGLPVGSRYFPLCVDSGSPTDPNCARIAAEGEKTLPQIVQCLWAGRSTSDTDASSDSQPSCLPKSGWYRYQLLAWLASCALAGLLIGLGGPFWFDAFAKLSSAVQVLGGLGLGQTERAKQADAAAAAASAAPPPPRTPAEAFRAASGSTAPKSTRILLGPKGTPLLGPTSRP